VREYFGEGLNDDVRAVLDDAIEKLRARGADVSEVSLPSLPLALAVYYVVVPAELSSNLSRHDGQRYQHAATEFSSLDESYTKSRSEGFGAEAKRRIMIGTHVLSSGYYDAYYNKAQTVRTKLVNEFKKAFSEYDFLIGPVAPSPAVEIGALSDDPLHMYLLDIMTVAANLVGIPAVSVPYAMTSDGLPVGVQIMADQGEDRALLGISQALEELATA
jgi:aspartyl-tRNA(Asn)/glutamyl-tRNA(Gln) amidotransferase subunit A